MAVMPMKGGWCYITASCICASTYRGNILPMANVLNSQGLPHPGNGATDGSLSVS